MDSGIPKGHPIEIPWNVVEDKIPLEKYQGNILAEPCIKMLYIKAEIFYSIDIIFPVKTIKWMY